MDEIKQLAAQLLAAVREHATVADLDPVRDRVLIMPVREETTANPVAPGVAGRMSASGLWMPDEEKHWRAMVVAVGPGTLRADGTRTAPDVSPGDVVVVGAGVGEILEMDGLVLRMCKAADIMGILVDEDAP